MHSNLRDKMYRMEQLMRTVTAEPCLFWFSLPLSLSLSENIWHFLEDNCKRLYSPSGLVGVIGLNEGQQAIM